jgi:hypothetical protein
MWARRERGVSNTMTHVTRNLGTVGMATPAGPGGGLARPAATRREIQARAPMGRAQGSLHSHRSYSAHGVPGFRTILIGLLAVVTAAAVGVLFLRGKDDAAAAGSFEAAHERTVAAIRAVPAAAAAVKRELQLDQFNAEIDKQLKTMSVQYDALTRLVRDNDGARKRIAQRAQRATELAINATQEFRRAIAVTNKLVDAQAAQTQLAIMVGELDAAAGQWEQT